jgi:hypothetical protein
MALVYLLFLIYNLEDQGSAASEEATIGIGLDEDFKYFLCCSLMLD